MTGHVDSRNAAQGSVGMPIKGRRRLGAWLGSAAIVVLVALGVTWRAFDGLGGGASHAAPAIVPPAPPVTVSAPLQRSVAASTTFTGQFSAVDFVEIRAQVSGYLTEIHFTDGQLVKKGDLLFVIDPRPFEIQLQQANAQYQTAQAQLDLAGKQLQRTAELKRSDFASGELLDQRQQQLRAGQAAVEQAKAAIRAAQLNLEFSRITAPTAGRISEHRVSVGNLVTGGAGAGSTTLLTTVVSLDPIHLDFEMSESDYLAYERFRRAASSGGAPDPTVEVSLSDEQGWPRRGALDFLDNRLDRGSGTIHARATLPNGDLFIAPGQFARLRLPVSAPRPVLLVPDAALATDQSRKIVMTVAADGTVVPKPVETGALSDGLRVITGGLAPDDRVVINGLARARPGGKVTPQPGSIALAAAQR